MYIFAFVAMLSSPQYVRIGTQCKQQKVPRLQENVFNQIYERVVYGCLELMEYTILDFIFSIFHAMQIGFSFKYSWIYNWKQKIII